jgi:hypothetical protein
VGWLSFRVRMVYGPRQRTHSHVVRIAQDDAGVEPERARIYPGGSRTLGSCSSKVDDEVVTALFGDKEVVTYEELHKVMKAQWDAVGPTPDLYTVNADVRRGRRRADHLYSREAMLKALRDRTAYLLKRGGTVNNRKISHGYVLENCIELNSAAWAKSLENAVAAEIEREPPNNLVSG